jgi:hypothetical protein
MCIAPPWSSACQIFRNEKALCQCWRVDFIIEMCLTGADGTPGLPGTPGTMGEPGSPSTTGTNGTPGKDGTPGAPGGAGPTGTPYNLHPLFTTQ